MLQEHLRTCLGGRGWMGRASAALGVQAIARVRSKPAAAAMAALGAMIACGCAAPQARTTQLRAADIELSATEMAQELADSEFLRGRTAESAVAVLQPRPMENLSDNRLSRGDQWAAMSMILMNPSVFEMLRAKNVQVLVPVESRFDAARAGFATNQPSVLAAAGGGSTGEPTHIFQPVLRSISRGGGGDARAGRGAADTRKDLFLMEYTITELASRRVVWAGQMTFARVAHGRLLD